MTGTAGSVRRSSIRVALTTTAVVGVVYVVISLVTLLIVGTYLTAQIDERLDGILDQGGQIQPSPPGGEDFDQTPGERPFEPPAVWVVAADGTITAVGRTPAALPSEYATIEGPETITVDGSDLRVEGRAIGSYYVIVGLPLQSVADARSTLLRAEALLAPFILVAVFLAAAVTSRRVAEPIERARVRQLEFTADASHELRTPLSVIEAHTTLALAQDRAPDWYRATFRRVDVESKRMRRLLEDMLWLARFDAAATPPGAEPVDAAVLATETVDRFRPVAETRRLTIDLQLDPGDQVVAVPPAWLDRLLGVLLDNAIKYSPEAGTVRVSVRDDAGRVRLTVEDDGPGIAEAERDRIFDRFHRATDAAGGAGLGLAIADAIVQATGGRWRVGSSSAGGASLSVAWRRAFAAGDQHRAPASDTARPPAAP